MAAFTSAPLVEHDRRIDTVIAEEYLTDPRRFRRAPSRPTFPLNRWSWTGGTSCRWRSADAFPLAEPFRETGDFMPHPLETERGGDRGGIGGLGRQTALGVQSGALHTEIKLTAEGPKIIEVNGRVAGGGINMVYAERNRGVPLTVLAASVALGLPIDGPGRCSTTEVAQRVRSPTSTSCSHPRRRRRLVAIGSERPTCSETTALRRSR